MRGSCFRFKQFSVSQDRCAMKVGTDGVLLGAWTQVDTAERILDIGTGTGLVALMLAQRSSAQQITAIEINEVAAGQAMENIERSPWKERIEVVCEDFTSYSVDTKYDVIVCNPPFFIDSLKSPATARTMARHNDSLTYPDLFQGVSGLLADSGEFTLIIPFDVLGGVVQTAESCALFPVRQLNIITTPGKPIKRVLVTFSFKRVDYQPEEMLLEEERHCYSKAYIELTRDFYLKM